jgi:SHS2 domain-containing protein
VSRYRILPHTADVAIAVTGSTLGEMLENAAYGMFDLMFDLAAFDPSREVVFEVAADNPTELLVDVLSDLLYRSETGDLAFCEFAAETARSGAGEVAVSMLARGAPLAGAELVGPPIKAVTYHGLQVAATDGGWEAEIVFDV